MFIHRDHNTAHPVVVAEKSPYTDMRYCKVCDKEVTRTGGEPAIRSIIGQTDKKSTAYAWAKKAREAGKQDVEVVRSHRGGFYTVSYDSEPMTPEEKAADRVTDETTPDSYVDEWTIPTPDYGPESEVEKRLREIAIYLDSHRSKVAMLEKGLRWRETRAPHLVPKWQQLIDDEMELITFAESEVAPLKIELEEIQRARSEGIAAFWSRVDQKIRPQVAGRSENSDLYIRATGKGGYRVDLATGKVIEGPHGDYPETVFGYEATVNGPDQAFGLDLTHGWKPATVRWGSYSGMETVADARRMMHVYEAAAELAVITNDLLGLGEEGTDR